MIKIYLLLNNLINENADNSTFNQTPAPRRMSVVFSTLALFLLMQGSLHAATYYLTVAGAANAQVPGSWNTDPAGTGTPAPNFYSTNQAINELFIIPNGINGTVSGNWQFGDDATAGKPMTLNVEGTLNISSLATLTLISKGSGTTTMTITGTGSIIFSSANTSQLNGSISGGGSATNNRFILSPGATLRTLNTNGLTGTNASIQTAILTLNLGTAANFDFNGAAQLTTGLPATVNNLTFSGSGAKTLTTTSPDAITGNLTLSGTVSVTAERSLNITGSVNIGSGTTFTGGAFTHFVGGNWTRGGTFAAASSTIEFNGSASQTIGTSNFNNITFSNTGIKTASGALSIAGTVTINSNFTSGNFTHTVGGNWIRIGTFTTGTSTINFNGTAAQSITAGNFHNISFTNAGVKTTTGALAMTGSVTITSNFTAGPYTHTVNGNWSRGGTFNATGSTIHFTGTAAQSIGTSNFNNIMFSNTGTKTASGAHSVAGSVTINSNFAAGSFTHTVAGDWIRTGTFTPGTSTINFNGTAAQSIQAGNFNNITFTNGGEKTTNGALAIAGSVNITSNFTAGPYTHTVGGNWTMTGTFTDTGSTIHFTGTGAQNIGASNFNNIMFSNAGTKTATGAHSIEGSVTINSNFAAGSFTHTVAGNWIRTGTFTPGTSTVEFNGTASQSIQAGNFNNISFTNNGEKTTNGPLNIAGSVTITGNFTAGPYTHTVGGNWNNTGTFIETGSTVNFNGTSPQGISPSNFNHIVFSNTGAKSAMGGWSIGGNITISADLSAGDFEHTLAGNWTNTGTFTANGSTVLFTGSVQQTINGNTAFNNLTIYNASGVKATSDFTVNGILNLDSANPNQTDGTLDMVISYDDYSNILTPTDNLTTQKTQAHDILNSYVLTMGPNATTTGQGDVTGRVKRISFMPNTEYSFGSPYSSITFSTQGTGTLPSDVTFVITKGADRGIHSNKTNTVQRLYQVISTGGTLPTTFSLKLRYADSELNGNNESQLVLWDHHIPYISTSTPHEHGKTAQNTSENWVSLTGHGINYLASGEVITTGFTKYWMINNTLIIGNKWEGAVRDDYTNWNNPSNWSAGRKPDITDPIVTIPVSTYYPTLPNENISLKAISIEAGAKLTAGSGTLTITGGTLDNGGFGSWSNYGTFNAGTSTVKFDYPRTESEIKSATISGTTEFYNLETTANTNLMIESGAIMRLKNTVINNGIFNASNSINTVEYTGQNQSVIQPNGGNTGYSTLVLSGSGTKTASTDLSISKSFTINPGVTFNGSSYTHSIAGNWINNGATSPSAGSVTFNGTTLQSIGGSAASTFGGLVISNPAGVETNADVTGSSLAINSGSRFTINPARSVTLSGGITNNAGADGLIIKANDTNPNGTLVFQGTAPAATVQMYSKASWTQVGTVRSNYKWQFFGIPVASLATTSPTFDGAFVRRYNETGTGSGTTADKRWIQLSNSSPLEHTTGYQVVQSAPKIYTFKGNLVNSDISRQLTYTDTAEFKGQHILGNPYTAAINIQNIDFGAAEQIVYLYNTGSIADWATNSGGTGENPGQYQSTSRLTAGTGGIPGQIASMQGFLVRTTTPTTLNIPYSATQKNTERQRVKAAATTEKAYSIIEVRGSRYADKMWLFSQAECTPGFDNGWDGRKFFGSSLTPQLYAITPDGNMQINATNDLNNTELGFYNGEDSSYKLRFTHSNLEGTYPALYLLDLQDNSLTDISLSGTEYEFAANTTNTGASRFRIVTSPGITTDLDGHMRDNTLKIFSRGRIIFVDNKVDTSGNLSVYDVAGVRVYTANFSKNSTSGLQTTLLPGTYLARGTAGGKQLATKIIIQ